MAHRARSAPRATKMKAASIPGSQRSPYESQPSYNAPDASAFANATILTSNELDFMRMSSLKQGEKPQTKSQTRSIQLKQRSKDRYKNWGNTLEALREKKKAGRVQRLEDAERAQQEIDRKEMLYQEQQRRHAIEKANKLLFQTNDKVKSLNSSLMLSTCMKERAKQIQIHRQRNAQAQRLEEMWAAVDNENLKKMVAREEKEELEQKQRSLQLARDQMDQLQDFRERQRLNLIAEIEEGERIKQMTALAMEDARQAELEHIAAMAENNKEYVRANEEQKRIKAERKKLEEAEEAKIEQYKLERERVNTLRAQKEAEFAKAKADRHEAMMTAQYNHLKSLRDQESARLEKEAEELKAKNDAAEKAEAIRVANLKQSIENSRMLSMKRKQEEQMRERALEEVMISEWKRRGKELDAQAIAAEQKQWDINRKNQTAVLQQVEEKRKRDLIERRDEFDHARQIALRKQKDDQIFLDYASQCINDAAAKGQSVVPMKLVLAKQERAPRTISIPY